MKKGFTIIELLSVIIIISLILLLVVPTVTDLISNSEKKGYKIQINTIKDAATNFTLENYSLFSSSDEFDSFTIDLKLLKDLAFIDYEIKNPITNKFFSDDTTIKLTRDKNTYKIEVLDFDSSSINDNVKYEDYFILIKANDLVDKNNVIVLNSNGSLYNGEYNVEIAESSNLISKYSGIDYSISIPGEEMLIVKQFSS